MRRYRAKIVKMNLAGVVSQILEVPVKENSLGDKTKTLEDDAWSYKYGNISIQLNSLDVDFFRTYDYFLDAYFLWVEKTDNEIVYETDYLGYISPDAIRTNLPSGKTSITTLSVEKLFDISPDIISRGSYQVLVTNFSINRSGGHAQISGLSVVEGDRYPIVTNLATFLAPIGIPSQFIEPGTFLSFSGSREINGSINVRTVFLNNATANNPGGDLFADVANFTAECNFHSIGNSVYPDDTLVSPARPYISRVRAVRLENSSGASNSSANPPVLVYLQDLELARNVKDQFNGGFAECYIGQTGTNNYDRYTFNIVSSKNSTFKVGVTEYEGVVFELTSPSDFGSRPAIWKDGTWIFSIPEPTINSSAQHKEAVLFGSQMYGVGGASSQGYAGEDVLQALCNLVPFFNNLSPQVVWHGIPGKIDRTIVLSPEPIKALNEIQKLLDVLVTFDFGAIQPSGLPQLVVNVYNRDFFASQPKTVIPVPIEWEEQPTAKLPTVIVRGPGPNNIYNPGSESVGWYSEDKDGVPNATRYATSVPSGKGNIDISIEKINLRTFSFFDGGIKDYYYNDWMLARIAENIYEFYGRFYRKIEAKAKDPLFVIPDLVGKIITEPYQDKDAIVLEQRTNYQNGDITFSLLMDTLNKI